MAARIAFRKQIQPYRIAPAIFVRPGFSYSVDCKQSSIISSGVSSVKSINLILSEANFLATRPATICLHLVTTRPCLWYEMCRPKRRHCCSRQLKFNFYKIGGYRFPSNAMGVSQVNCCLCCHLLHSKRACFEQLDHRRAAAATTRLDMCLIPQQTTEMTPPICQGQHYELKCFWPKTKEPNFMSEFYSKSRD